MICPHCEKAISSQKITPRQKQEVIRLSKEGYSARDIQQLTGVSFSSAARILREQKKGT